MALKVPTAVDCGSPLVTEESMEACATDITRWLQSKQSKDTERSVDLMLLGLPAVDRDDIAERIHREYAQTYYLGQMEFVMTARAITRLVRDRYDPASTVLYKDLGKSGMFLPMLLPEYRHAIYYQGTLKYYSEASEDYVPIEGEQIVALDDWALTSDQMTKRLELFLRHADLSKIQFVYMAVSEQAKLLAKKIGVGVDCFWDVPSPSIVTEAIVPMQFFTRHNIYGYHKISDTTHPILGDSSRSENTKYSIFVDREGNLLPRGKRFMHWATTAGLWNELNLLEQIWKHQTETNANNPLLFNG